MFSTGAKRLSLAQKVSKSFSPLQGIVSILPGLPVLLTACSPHSSKGPLRPGICELLGHAGDLCAKHEVGHARAELGPAYMPGDMLSKSQPSECSLKTLQGKGFLHLNIANKFIIACKRSSKRCVSMERELKLIPKKEMYLSDLSLAPQGRMKPVSEGLLSDGDSTGESINLANCILAQRAGADITDGA